jgi:two-component system sensor histidine kinase HydH
MREVAVTGDLDRRVPVRSDGWGDEDTRLLATTFNSQTQSLSRFQRESAQRERLSSIGRLSTVIAHEIRNPLMIIKTALRALRRADMEPAAVRHAADDIAEEVDRLNRLVTEVLDFARPITFDITPVDLSHLCRDASAAVMAGDQTAGAGPSVRLSLDPAAADIDTDAERLRLVLVNLLGNARDAVLQSGKTNATLPDVELATSVPADGRVAITVRDRGAGIAAGDLPRVFDPYFTTKRTGSGLGLAIAKNIVEGLGGRITVQSEAGSGTEIRVDLPRVGPGPAHRNAPRAGTSSSSGVAAGA